MGRKTTSPRRPLRIINCTVPIRICDIGGWTDTWFAKHGRVLNIAVTPSVDVQIRVYPHAGRRERITIIAENYGERYTIAEPKGIYDKHPLLEAAIEYMGVPKELDFEVAIFSEAPSGCATGTSAAVSVALLGALDVLTPGRMTPHEVAAAAQRVETELLGQQCGIQDQLAGACGGISLIDMPDYPHASVSRIEIPEAAWWELESRLALVYLGRAHSSSDVHRMVIKGLESAGAEAPPLQRLRALALRAKDALYAGDFRAFGKCMVENTEAQAALHEELVGPFHREVIEVARRHGALGWKVNGAGGQGGSVTLLSSADRTARRAMLAEIAAADALFKVISIRLSPWGLRIWETAD